jgi:hypothetical protein
MLVSRLPEDSDSFLANTVPTLHTELTKMPQLPRKYWSQVTRNAMATEYSEFSLPEYFIVFVQRRRNAIRYLRDQLKPESPLISWLDVLEEEITEEREEDE